MARSGRPLSLPGAAIADWCPSALLIGVTGALALQGHDALALTLGVAGAVFLSTGIVAPALASANGPQTLPAALAERLGGRGPGIAAAAIMITALLGLLAAELLVLAAVIGRLAALPTGGALGAAALLAACGGTAIAMLAPSGSPHRLSGAVLAGLTGVSLLAVILALTADSGPGGIVSTPALSQIAALEQSLLERKLADPATFKPHGVPFLRVDVTNFLAMITTLAIGLALLSGPYAHNPASAGGRQVPGLARTAMAVLCLIALLPPLAAACKRALLGVIDQGLKATALPDWTAAYRASGALEVCGSASLETAVVVKACGKGVGREGLMRWQDLSLSQDAAVFAGVDAAKAGPLVVAVMAVVAILAALWTTGRIARLAASLLPRQPGGSDVSRLTRGAIALACVAAAALIAVARPADAATLLAWAAALAMAGLAPAVIAASLQPPPSEAGRRPVTLRPIGAVAAMILGAAIALTALLGARYAPLTVYAWSGPLTHAPPAVVRKLATLEDTWSAAPDGPGKEALRLQAAKLARDHLNWFGLKPLAAGLIGAMAGAIVLLGAIGASWLVRRSP